MPCDVRSVAPGNGLAVEEAVDSKAGVTASQCDQLTCEPQHVTTDLVQSPVEPAQRVVLAPGVVVSALASQHFVAREQHGHTTRQHEKRHAILRLAQTER